LIYASERVLQIPCICSIESCHALILLVQSLRFYSLSLFSHCGKEVTNCSTEEQHIIKLIQGGYALRVSTGSTF